MIRAGWRQDHAAHQALGVLALQTFTDLFVQDQRQSQTGGFIAKLAAMDELIDFAAIAVQVNSTCLPP